MKMKNPLAGATVMALLASCASAPRKEPMSQTPTPTTEAASATPAAPATPIAAARAKVAALKQKADQDPLLAQGL